MSEEIRNVAYIFSYVSFPNNARHFILLILIATYYNNQHLTTPNHSIAIIYLDVYRKSSNTTDYSDCTFPTKY